MWSDFCVVVFCIVFASLREKLARSANLLTTLCIPSLISSTLKLISSPNRRSVRRKYVNSCFLWIGEYWTGCVENLRILRINLFHATPHSLLNVESNLFENPLWTDQTVECKLPRIGGSWSINCPNNQRPLPNERTFMAPNALSCASVTDNRLVFFFDTSPLTFVNWFHTSR